MAAALAILFVAGGCLTILAILLPHPDSLQTGPATVNAVVAIVAGITLFAVGHLFPKGLFQVFVGGGSILVAVGIHVGGYGAETPPFAFFYVWVAVYSFYFFEQRHAVIQLLLGAASHLAVLIVDARPALAVTGWLLTWGIISVTGLVVGWLSLRVKTLAETDSLTGLRNRRAWDSELQRQLANAARAGTAMCVMLLDLDGLKRINDEHGHQAGDRLLKAAAAAWIGVVRSGDLVARLGGDEFGILLPGCSPSGANALLLRLQGFSTLRFSAGVAYWDGSESPEELVRRADADLYRVKSIRRDLPDLDPQTP
jgi:diguanylate cyclase (GGDEF)-like protein